MRVSIYTIEKIIFEGEAKEIVAKTTSGEITVLDQHAPLVSRLLAATLVVTDLGGERRQFPIAGGFLEVQPESRVTVLVE